LVAVFIIANTFLISVTQLRRQFGIMRAIGATRRQIARLVIVQALILGAIGTVLGSLLGLGVATYLVKAMGSLYSTTLPPIELTATPFILAALFGLGVSVAGAFMPARKAAHLSPVEAIRAELPVAIEGTSRWLVIFGGVLVVVCSGVLAASILGKIPMGAAVWASVVLLIGVVLMLPLGLKPLSRAAAALLQPWMPVETRLATRQLLRHRSRTTLTVGVVFVAISTGIGLANSVIDNVNDRIFSCGP
jgi:putative ABC transport system permease protein